LDKITIAGAAFALIALASLAYIIVQHPFEAFSYSLPADRLVPISSDVGSEGSVFMWTYRSLDLIAQAFAIFAAAVACLAMLRVDKEGD
jgi:hypothetical protein